MLAVTHLAQVAACADQHTSSSAKALKGMAATAERTCQPVAGEARVAEIARMLGGERLSGTAHCAGHAAGIMPADTSRQCRAESQKARNSERVDAAAGDRKATK